MLSLFKRSRTRRDALKNQIAQSPDLLELAGIYGEARAAGDEELKALVNKRMDEVILGGADKGDTSLGRLINRDAADAARWRWLRQAKSGAFDNLSIRLPEQMDAYADACIEMRKGQS